MAITRAGSRIVDKGWLAAVATAAADEAADSCWNGLGGARDGSLEPEIEFSYFAKINKEEFH